MMSSSLFSNQQKGEKMNIETLRKKETWELRVMVKALSQSISSFLNTNEDNKRLENAKLVLAERRERAEEIRQRKIAIQRVDAQTKSIKKW